MSQTFYEWDQVTQTRKKSSCCFGALHNCLCGSQREGPKKEVEAAVILGNEECACCLETLEETGETQVSLFACGHAFHTLCIEKWKEVASTCPLCRAVLS